MKNSMKKVSEQKTYNFINQESNSLIIRNDFSNKENFKEKESNTFCNKKFFKIILIIISILSILYFILMLLIFYQIIDYNLFENKNVIKNKFEKENNNTSINYVNINSNNVYIKQNKFNDYSFSKLENKNKENSNYENIKQNKTDSIYTPNIYYNKKENLTNGDIIKLKRKRIGVVGVDSDQNPGNNLIKYAMYTKLKEYGFDPIIVGKIKENNRIDFLSRTVKLKIVEHYFSELKRNDFDILMINSDLCWLYSDIKFFYHNAFLKFAETWNIPKFIYGASMGTMDWAFTKTDEEIAKTLLKNFTGISFREIGTAKMAAEHLNINYTFVLDPTFLLDKQYYLDLIKNYQRDFDFTKKYLMVYQLDKNPVIKRYIKESIEKFNFTIYRVSHQDQYYVENFLFAMNISEAVITDSYHGSVFSIIFNKPFISFINYLRGAQRFISLNETFNLQDRIINSDISKINLSPLVEPLKINQTKLDELKNISINYLKSNLGI